MAEEVVVRFARESDISRLAKISAGSLVPPWNEANFADALENELCKVLISEVNNTVCGYVVCYHAADEGEIPSIAVMDSFRRRGVAKAILKDLIKELQKENISKIFLEVRESNEAGIGLYKSMGFLSVGVRKNFYSAPVEDGIIMVREIYA